jgi:hypothetical protein
MNPLSSSNPHFLARAPDPSAPSVPPLTSTHLSPSTHPPPPPASVTCPHACPAGSPTHSAPQPPTSLSLPCSHTPPVHPHPSQRDLRSWLPPSTEKATSTKLFVISSTATRPPTSVQTPSGCLACSIRDTRPRPHRRRLRTRLLRAAALETLASRALHRPSVPQRRHPPAPHPPRHPTSPFRYRNRNRQSTRGTTGPQCSTLTSPPASGSPIAPSSSRSATRHWLHSIPTAAMVRRPSAAPRL